jgi:hypothetical protein
VFEAHGAHFPLRDLIICFNNQDPPPHTTTSRLTSLSPTRSALAFQGTANRWPYSRSSWSYRKAQHKTCGSLMIAHNNSCKTTSLWTAAHNNEDLKANSR